MITLQNALILVLWVMAITVPIYATNDGRLMARKPYAIRMLGLLLCVVFVPAVAQAVGRQWWELSVVATLILSVFSVIWSVRRAQDAGWSKWWNMLTLLPLVALCWWVVLMALPTKAPGERAPAAS